MMVVTHKISEKLLKIVAKNTRQKIKTCVKVLKTKIAFAQSCRIKWKKFSFDLCTSSTIDKTKTKDQWISTATILLTSLQVKEFKSVDLQKNFFWYIQNFWRAVSFSS